MDPKEQAKQLSMSKKSQPEEREEETERSAGDCLLASVEQHNRGNVSQHAFEQFYYIRIFLPQALSEWLAYAPAAGDFYYPCSHEECGAISIILALMKNAVNQGKIN